jgi:hypothetical protein
MRRSVILIATILLTLTACTTPSYTSTGARPSPDELASFDNLSYTMNYTNNTLSYNVTVLTPRPIRTTTHNATVTKNSLHITPDTTNPASQQIIIPTTVHGSLNASRPRQLIVNDDIPAVTGRPHRINWETRT